jgi:hypothetical protein
MGGPKRQQNHQNTSRKCVFSKMRLFLKNVVKIQFFKKHKMFVYCPNLISSVAILAQNMFTHLGSTPQPQPQLSN